MNKVFVRGVSHILTNDQNRIQMNTFQECLDLFKRYSAGFPFYNIRWNMGALLDARGKVVVKQWEQVKLHQRTRKWFHLQEKLWLQFLLDSRGVVLDYLRKGWIITGDYYASLLDKEKVLLHDDTALAHTSRVIAAKNVLKCLRMHRIRNMRSKLRQVLIL